MAKLQWTKTNGAYPGAVAHHYPYSCRVTRWQIGSWSASFRNLATGEEQFAGNLAGELRTRTAAQDRCEQWASKLG